MQERTYSRLKGPCLCSFPWTFGDTNVIHKKSSTKGEARGCSDPLISHKFAPGLTSKIFRRQRESNHRGTTCGRFVGEHLHLRTWLRRWTTMVSSPCALRVNTEWKLKISSAWINPKCHGYLYEHTTIFFKFWDDQRKLLKVILKQIETHSWWIMMTFTSL